MATIANKMKKTSFEDYDRFVEKFKVKKTTDDCYTPVDVYNVILNFLSERFDLRELNILRPFFPGGDYEKINYQFNDVVIDNPPFSIVSQIARFYTDRNIKFFIFAPHMTLFGSDIDCCHVVCGAEIVYENGARVKTSFLTNFFENTKVMGASELYNSLNRIYKKNTSLPKYQYPKNVLTVSDVQKLVERGVNFCVETKHLKHIRGLDDQKKYKKALFGSGFLLSDKATAEKLAAEKLAAEKLAAEKLAAEKVNVMVWKLSDNEQKKISELG